MVKHLFKKISYGPTGGRFVLAIPNPNQYEPVVEYLSPPEVVLLVLGGFSKAARLLNLEESNFCRWRYKGLIPSHHMRPILELAKKLGKPLTCEDLVLGRKIERAWPPPRVKA